ncbi:hypothetical protein JCM4914_30560 [Streptomyces platensis subsp. malvinus]
MAAVAAVVGRRGEARGGTDRKADGRTDRQTGGRTDGQTDGQTDGRTGMAGRVLCTALLTVVRSAQRAGEVAALDPPRERVTVAAQQ